MKFIKFAFTFNVLNIFLLKDSNAKLCILLAIDFNSTTIPVYFIKGGHKVHSHRLILFKSPFHLKIKSIPYYPCRCEKHK